MLPALVWSAIPAYVLGRAKLTLASQLHDKVLYADAKMNKADWMTAGAAGIGVIGIGFGFWWADAVAALAISLDIAHDGWTNVRAAARDLMDEQPSTYDDERPHPLNGRIQEELEGLPWVGRALVRMREEGHVFEVEAFVVPADGGPGAARAARRGAGAPRGARLEAPGRRRGTCSGAAEPRTSGQITALYSPVALRPAAIGVQ